MSKTTWQETFRAPRFAANPERLQVYGTDVTANEIWGKANAVMKELNGEERDALPAFVKAELADRSRSGWAHRRCCDGLN